MQVKCKDDFKVLRTQWRDQKEREKRINSALSEIFMRQVEVLGFTGIGEFGWEQIEIKVSEGGKYKVVKLVVS